MSYERIQIHNMVLKVRKLPVLFIINEPDRKGKERGTLG